MILTLYFYHGKHYNKNRLIRKRNNDYSKRYEMKKEELVQHLKDIRARARLNLMKLAFFSAALGGTASAAGAVPGSDSHTASGYNAGAIRVVPKAVNIAKSGSAKPIYEFENKAYEGRREVREYAGVTRYSLWDCSYKREVGNEANPVGVARTFYGSLQFNRFNAENMAIYALQQSQFADLADKFFYKGAGFEQAVKAFNEDFKKQGYLAYHNRMRVRSRLVSFLKPDYKQIFIREGADNSSQMLRLQRDYASEVYCTFDESGLRRIKEVLQQQGIRPEQINPAIWGMFLAKHIKGGFSGIATELKGLKPSDINSLSFVEKMKRRFPSVFAEGSGINAYKFAKEHWQEKHSVTTMRELSLVLKQPQLFENYLKTLPFNQNGTLTWEQAQEIAQNAPRKMVSFKPVAAGKLLQENSKLPPRLEKINVVKVPELVKAKKSKQLSR